MSDRKAEAPPWDTLNKGTIVYVDIVEQARQRGMTQSVELPSSPSGQITRINRRNARGGVLEAIVYSRILFWFGRDSNGEIRTKTRIGGDPWYRETRRQVARDTGLSVQQVGRALVNLEKWGWIETRPSSFKGRKATCIRPTESVKTSRKRLVFVRSALVQVIASGNANDVIVALLLSQLLYWFRPTNGGPRARITINGQLWIAKSARELAEETGTSEGQVKRGLGCLRGLKLIDVVIRQFRFSPTMHLRPRLDVLEAMLAKRREQTNANTGNAPVECTGNATVKTPPTHASVTDIDQRFEREGEKSPTMMGEPPNGAAAPPGGSSHPLSAPQADPNPDPDSGPSDQSPTSSQESEPTSFDHYLSCIQYLTEHDPPLHRWKARCRAASKALRDYHVPMDWFLAVLDYKRNYNLNPFTPEFLVKTIRDELAEDAHGSET